MADSRGHDKQINYIEFNVDDISCAKDFYGNAFGWTFTDYGPDYCEFNDGNLKGGFAHSDGVKTGGPLVILFADDLADTLTRVKTAGGTIAKEIFDFPGGRRFHFRDPEGYELAVWSDK